MSLAIQQLVAAVTIAVRMQFEYGDILALVERAARAECAAGTATCGKRYARPGRGPGHVAHSAEQEATRVSTQALSLLV